MQSRIYDLIDKRVSFLPHESKVREVVIAWGDEQYIGGIYRKPLSERTIDLNLSSVMPMLGELQDDFSNFIRAFTSRLASFRREQDASRKLTYDGAMSLLKYLVSIKVLDEETIKQLRKYKPRRLQEPKRTIPDLEDIKQLLKINQKTSGNSEYDKYINEACILLSINTGTRRQELCDICLSDINIIKRQINIKHGKGNRSRLVGINDEVLNVVKKLIALRPASDYDNLLLQANGKPYSGKTLGQKFRRLVKATKLNISLHSLRRFFCVYWISKKKVPLPIVQRCMGHSDVRLTANIYFQYQEKEVCEEMSKWGGVEL